jgi:NAD(P)H-quinone oxidoreductase subunit 5
MLTQTSIKVSLAYSTVAQMGFMVLQCGLGAYSAALLHIVAHSLYKAHAFLSSGSVIDLARASWTPSPGGQPHQARIAIAVVIVLAAALGVAVMFDATPWSDPGAFILGAIVLLGLTHLMANAIDERPSTYVIGRCAAAAVGVAVVYFSLQAATAALTVDSLPPNQPLRGAWNLILVGVVLLGFAAVTVLQSLVPRQSGQAWWHALYVHLSHGLYVNTLANRLVLRLWPGPAPRPIAAQHTNLKGV